MPMSAPKVSIIIPAYNQAEYVAEAIQSVLDQTYTDFEIVVVNDGSTDQTHEVLSTFKDQRIKYFWQPNRGLPAARNSGIRASSGEILAFLDADDKFHPEKLRLHLEFLDQNPKVGLTYNSRFEIDSGGSTLQLIRVPTTVTLADLVRGFPFSPSDVVIRREWAFKIGLYDESFVLNSEDLDFNLRLSLAGCQFAGIGRSLNYRRLHSGRLFKDIPAKLDTMLRALETAFSSPLCPDSVRSLRDTVYANYYLIWSYLAGIQNITALAQTYLQEAIRLDPSILDRKAFRYLQFISFASVRNGEEHEVLVRKVFAQLLPELEWLSKCCDWVIARGYLLQGVRDIMWGRHEQANAHFSRAADVRAIVDKCYLRELTAHLLTFEAECGTDATKVVLRNLCPHIQTLGGESAVRWLNGCFAINRAFSDYHSGRYANVPGEVMRAIVHDRSYLTNRGVIAMLARSMITRVSRPQTQNHN
jgi:GT2 family glycosyltransferase